MPQLPMHIRKTRAAELRAKGDAAFIRFLDSRIGQRERLLIEDDTTARSEHYLPARLDRGDAAGRIVDAVAIGRDGKMLIARRTA
jgi:threonylcarbamoyladenosine tRNA methylthiotransferase MtaB